MAWQIAKMIIDDVNREVSSSPQSRADALSETADSVTSGTESRSGEQYYDSTNL